MDIKQLDEAAAKHAEQMKLGKALSHERKVAYTKRRLKLESQRDLNKQLKTIDHWGI